MKSQKLQFTMALFLISALTGCNLPIGGSVNVNVTINSHSDGQSVVLLQETRVVSLVRASQGVEKVQLFINGQLIHTDTPLEGNPKEYIADQPWIPDQEGNMIITVVATDVKGNTSEPVSITVQVVPSISAGETTNTPTATSEMPAGETPTVTLESTCTNEAVFVEDVTIPVNSYLSPGATFTKIWRVNNSGTCDWMGYQLILVSGDLMGATTPQALPITNAGSQIDVALDLTAPTTPGSYTATWRLRAESGTVFGPDLSLTIIVPQPSTNTPTPTQTQPSTATPTATATATPTTTATTPPLFVEQIYEQITIESGTTGNTTVTCPAGSIVVSGGFASSSGLRVYHSMMDDNGWRVYANNTSGSSKLLNVYAVCMHNSGGSVTQAFVQDNAVANDIAHLDVACPAGSFVTGGGWVIGSTNPVEIYNSSKKDNGWQIYINNSGGDTPLINAYAICLSDVSGSTTQVYESADVPANDIGNAIASCPAGSTITGGGFATNLGVIIYNTSIKDNGWQNYARNDLGTEKGLNTYAICYTP